MEEKNSIDELFREGLEGREIKPSAAAWDKISAGLESKPGKGGSFFLMRAAVITVLVGLSTWMYFSHNEDELMNPGPSIEKKKEVIKTTGTKGTGEKEKEKPSAGTGKKEEKKPSKKQIIPIMRQAKTSDAGYVGTDKKASKAGEKSLPEEENKETHPAVEADVPVHEIASGGGDIKAGDPELIVSENKGEKRAEPRIKLKYAIPVTEKTFYAHNDQEEEPKLKERVLAYAGNQVENVLNGKRMELPKRDKDKKHGVEINLGRIFN